MVVAAPLFWRDDVIVSAALALCWLTMKSRPEVDGPRRMLPLIVTAFAPTFGVTRMPPESTLFVPVSVSVTGAAVLNRSVFTENAEGDWFEVTSVLFVEALK